MKLTRIEKTAAQAWFRTPDGRFDILGEDLNTNNAAGRAAGAGAVWLWRPAKATRDWTNDMSRAFATKAACLADLEAHIAASAPQAAATSSGRVPGATRAALDDLMETLADANAPFVGAPVHRVPPATPRPPDPVDLMMAGDYVGAIAAYRAIIAEFGDPLDVCAAQIATCKEALRKIALCDDVKAIVACASCAQQNRVIVGVPSRCGKCKAPMSVGVAL